MSKTFEVVVVVAGMGLAEAVRATVTFRSATTRDATMLEVSEQARLCAVEAVLRITQTHPLDTVRDDGAAAAAGVELADSSSGGGSSAPTPRTRP